MVLLIDNYDNFSYNLYQIIGLKKEILVLKNDEVDIEKIETLGVSHLIISSGGGKTSDQNVIKIIQHFSKKIPILGIGLGMFYIYESFSTEISYVKTLVHGKQKNIHIASGNPIFKNLPPIIYVGRYDWFCIDRNFLSDNFLVIAEDNENNIMGIKHKDFNIYGVQFHPESILTTKGKQIIENFILEI